MKKVTPFALILLLSCAHIRAIPVEYVSNYDGDTITVNLTELKKIDKTKTYSLFWDKISVRLGGINTPEIKGACPKEKKLAQEAKQFVDSTIRNAQKITLDNIGKDKYFRILGDIYVDEVPLAQLLIEKGYAVPYDGRTKNNIWCQKVPAKKPGRFKSPQF